MNPKKKSEEPAEVEKGRVIPFPQRNSVAARLPEAPRGPPQVTPLPRVLQRDPPPLKGVPERDADYRHRMWVNAGAFALCAALVALGVWMATTMADLRRGQDCVLTGRANCAPVATPARLKAGDLPAGR